MKRKILAALLLICLLASLLPASAAAGIYFVAFNDTVPMTLSTDVAPYFQGGILLAPHTAFAVNGSGVTANYDTQSRVVTLHKGSKRLEIDLIDGVITDEAGNESQTTCAMRSGAAFLPVAFCAAHFGISVSLQVSRDNYQVLRLTNGAQVYDDALFMQKAETLIDYRVKQYLSQQEQATQPAQTTKPTKPAQSTQTTKPTKPETTEKPVTQPAEQESEKPSPNVYLALVGLQDAEASMRLLLQKGVPAVFFLTEEEILSQPDLVRAIRAAGFDVGITANPQEENPAAALRAANDALDRVTRSKTLLALLTSAQAETTEEYCAVKRDRAVAPSRITEMERTRYLVLCTNGCRSVLPVLETANARFRQLRETTNF